MGYSSLGQIIRVSGAALMVILGAAAARAAPAPAAGTTYVVAQLHPQASDDNPGTPARPFLTIGRAAREVKPGDTVLIHDGVYRECVAVETSGAPGRPIRFLAAPMANVVVTGADALSEWTREEGEEGVYGTAWPHEYLGWTKRQAHPDDDYHLMIGRAEQVHVGGYGLLQVLSRQKLSRGTFYVDTKAKRLYLCDRAGRDPVKAKLPVEASIRSSLWQCKASYVHVRGLRFRYAANHAQQGAVDLRGDHNVLEDCVIERVNGSGAVFTGADVVARRCVFRDNGWSGFDVNGSQDFRMTECVCENNNVKDWDRNWGAVDKLCLSRGAIIERSVFRGNRGHGLWFDIGNENCTVRNCLIADNEDAGLFYEISYGLHAHDNVIIGNGLALRPGSWGANGGIALSSSPHCVIERNLLIANKEGVQFREQARTTPRIGERRKECAVWNHDSAVRNNVIACNRDTQIAGWFALGDGSHWPRALQQKMLGKPVPAGAPLPAGADPDRLAKRPEGLSLEDLRLKVDGNLYCVRPGQHLCQWGCPWDPHEYRDSLEQVRALLGFDTESRTGDLPFADWTTLDLRVPADSPLVRMHCYPQGEVPGVRLGIVKKGAPGT